MINSGGGDPNHEEVKGLGLNMMLNQRYGKEACPKIEQVNLGESDDPRQLMASKNKIDG